MNLQIYRAIIYKNIIILYGFPSSEVIMDSHNDELLVDLIAQLVEQCSDISKSRVRVLLRHEIISILIKQHSEF